MDEGNKERNHYPDDNFDSRNGWLAASGGHNYWYWRLSKRHFW